VHLASLHSARANITIKCNSLCFSSEHGETALHTACIYGHVDIIDALIVARGDVNARGTGEHSLRMTPLHWCSAAGYTKAVVRLVEAGAEVNSVCDTTKGVPTTAWQLAMDAGHAETAAALARHGGKGADGRGPHDRRIREL
jgi:ankyrin repeat protein